MRWLGPLLTLSLVASCAYPRRSTSLTPASLEHGEQAPGNVWKLRFISAQIPPRKRSGMSWDENENGPDAFLRFIVDGRTVFETPIIEDNIEPAWNAEPPANVEVPPGTPIRIELWDSDELGPDPIGMWAHQGLPPNALPDADARVLLDGGASIVFRVLDPHPHRGVGVKLYEFRGKSLLLLDIAQHSPAGRAGLQRGDKVMAVGGRSIDELGQARAATALSLASERQQPLTVRRADGTEEDITLDAGYVWLTQ